MRKAIATALIGAGAVFTMTACGDNESDDTTDATMETPAEITTEPTGTEDTEDTDTDGMTTDEEVETSTSVTSTDQLGTIDQAKLDAFVVAFRTGYSDLSENRDDESIENIVITSCNDLAGGVSEEEVTQNIRTLAANGGTEPSPEQAEQIYDIVTPACP